jgi:hypothetical protein
MTVQSFFCFLSRPFRVRIKRRAIDFLRCGIDRDGEISARYEWRRGNKWGHLAMVGRGESQSIPAGSHEEFITEHHWGYTRRSPDRTNEYRVEHPRWKIWPATSYEFRADIAALYGDKFLAPLTAPPASAFIVDGSFVAVYRRSSEEA